MTHAPVPPASSPALSLLLTCLCWPVDAEAIRAAAVDADAAGWAALPPLATRHRVEALVDNALRAAGVAPPADVAAALGGRTRGSSFLELAYAREAAGLFAMLREAGLHPLLLKGAATALLCYGRLGLKASRDLDLLVPEDEAARALALLEGQGFAAAGGEHPRDPRWRRRHKDTVLTREGSPLLIELHWRLFDNPALEPRRADDASRALSLYPGGAVETLGRDAFFAYLCLHGAQHAWSRLKWLAEFDAFVSADAGGAGDADALWTAAGGRQARHAAAQAFVLRAQLLGKPAPRGVERLHAASRRLRWLVALALRSALAGGSTEMEDRPLGSTAKNISHYLLAGGARYWLHELRYDLGDDRAAPPGAARRFGVAGRLAGWLGRAFKVKRDAYTMN